MKKHLDQKSRKELADKILALIGDKMQPLSKEFQMILADDLVTAFENRFKLLNQIQTSTDFYVEMPQKVTVNE